MGNTHKKWDKKKIGLFILVGMNIDTLICSIIVLLHKPKETPIPPTPIDYGEMANNFSHNLLKIVNDNIDMIKPDAKYDVTSILSLSIDDAHQTLYGSAYNDNYISGFTLKYHSGTPLYDEVVNHTQVSMNVNVLENDISAENPLLSDSGFIETYANSLVYKIGKDTSPTYRSISFTYVGKQSQIYSISPYTYEIGSFNYKDIPSQYVTIYNKDDSKYPYIYRLFKGE